MDAQKSVLSHQRTRSTAGRLNDVLEVVVDDADSDHQQRDNEDQT
jgi:hypothetical protein